LLGLDRRANSTFVMSETIRRLGLDASLAAEGFEQLAADAFCCICRDYLEDVVEADCQARHVFCRPCLQGVFDRDQTCPQCRGDIYSMDTAHMHIRSWIENVKWKCFNHANGCVFKGTKEQLEEHLDKECQEHQQKCRFQGCQERRRRPEIPQHETDCPYRLVPCDHCKKDVVFQTMVEHLTVCDDVPVPCPNACGKNPSRGLVADHLDTECEEYVVTCEVPGCGEQVKRKEMETHEEGNQKKHLKLLTTQLIENEKRHEEEIERLSNELNADERNVRGHPDRDVVKLKVRLPLYEEKATEKAKGSKLKSASFTFQGFQFCIWVYPKGDNLAADGNASVFLVKLDDYAGEITYVVEGAGKRRTATHDFSKTSVGGGMGWCNFCTSRELFSLARQAEDGALDLSVRLSAPAVGSNPLLVRGYV